MDSVCNQSYKNIEIICIEDASQDNSYNILKMKAKRDQRIRIIKNPENKGLSYNRNKGIEVSKGEYVVFVDSDDMIKPNMIEVLVKQIQANNNPEIIYYDMQIINEGNVAKEREIEYKKNKEIFSKVCTGKELYLYLNKNDSLIEEACRQIIKRDFLVLNNVSFYEGIYHEDCLFSFYCAMRANRVFYLNTALYIYRRRDNSITATMNFKRVESYFIVFIELWNFWKNKFWSDDINVLFESYLNNVYRAFISSALYFDNNKLEDFGSYADSYMFKKLFPMQGIQYRDVSLKDEIIIRLKNASSVMVYGAGMIGVEVVNFLKEKGVYVNKVLVSDKKNNPSKIMEIPIIQYDDLQLEKIENLIIILAVSKDNKYAIADIKNKLRMSGLKQVIMYDGSML